MSRPSRAPILLGILPPIRDAVPVFDKNFLLRDAGFWDKATVARRLPGCAGGRLEGCRARREHRQALQNIAAIEALTPCPFVLTFDIQSWNTE